MVLPLDNTRQMEHVQMFTVTRTGGSGRRATIRATPRTSLPTALSAAVAKLSTTSPAAFVRPCGFSTKPLISNQTINN